MRIAGQLPLLNPVPNGPRANAAATQAQLFQTAFGTLSSTQAERLSRLSQRLAPDLRRSLLAGGASRAGDTAAADRTDFSVLSLASDLARGSRSSGLGAAGQRSAVDSALLQFDRLFTPQTQLGLVETAIRAGLDAKQFDDFDVVALAPNAELTIRGTVTRAAEAARLAVRGGDGAVAAESAAFRLSSAGAIAMFQITQGEQLSDVADRINQQTATVGVSAAVAGNDLVLSSVGVGRNATFRLEQLPSASSSVDGVNVAQVADFQVNSLAAGSTEAITGSVVSDAAQAQLRYVGRAGALVAGTVTMQVTGSAGTAAVNITEDESLQDVAQRVNDLTATTGVVATVDGNDLLLRSEDVGSSASIQVQLTDREEEIVTTGVNGSQVASLNVTAIDPGSQHTLTGSVQRSAAQAELTLQIADQGLVVDAAEFELSGTAGSASVTVAAGEALADVAARINGLSGSTGVTASVSGDDLLLSSVATGDNETVAVQLTSIDHHLLVSGVNDQQLEGFQALSLTDGIQHTLSGSITQTAGEAELTFQGLLGRVGTNATFTLSGSTGSAEFTVTALQQLSDLANQINQQTASTGVAASVAGSTLTLRSTGVGSAASVVVDVTAGTFNVSGGNGDGTANGTDAVAVINGDTVVGSGNAFSFSDSAGSYSFTAADGFTGVFDTVTVDSQPGQFDVVGGNGDGTANGLNALADVNGQQLSSAGNQFTVALSGAEFALEFVADFVGAFDAITVTSNLAEFDLQGGDANGTAAGLDAVATINGTQRTGDGRRFNFAGEHGSFVIEFAEAFTGAFDAIAATADDGALELSGDNGAGLATGSDALALINGRERVGDGARFVVGGDGVQVAIAFAAGFQGAFDSITVSPRAAAAVGNSALDNALAEQLAGFANSRLPLSTTGKLQTAALQQGRSATRRLLRRLAQVDGLQSDAAGSLLADNALNSDAFFSAARRLAGQFDQLGRTDPRAILASVDLQSLDTMQHRRLVLDLLRQHSRSRPDGG